MARPLRIEFPGATYHVTARGNRREPIFVDEADRASLLDVLAQGTPAAWVWSSCRAHVGAAPAPAWLDTRGLHAHLLGRASQTAGDAARAAHRYAALVGSEPELQLWSGALQQQIYLGDEGFVSRMQALASSQAAAAAEVPRIQRRPPGLVHRANEAQKHHEPWLVQRQARSMALWRAYREEGVTMTTLAARCGLSVSRVSRLIAKGKT